MSKWRDVKQNRVEKNIPKKVLHSSLNFVSIAKRFKAFIYSYIPYNGKWSRVCGE